MAIIHIMMMHMVTHSMVTVNMETVHTETQLMVTYHTGIALMEITPIGGIDNSRSISLRKDGLAF